MNAISLGQPVCVAGPRQGTSALRMRFEVSDDVDRQVTLKCRPVALEGPSAQGRPARIWQDNHVVAGLEVASSELREMQRLTLELCTAGDNPRSLWCREVLVERVDAEQGLHHLSLVL